MTMIALLAPQPCAACWSWSPLGIAASAPAAAAACSLEVTAAAAAFLGSAFSPFFDLTAGVAGARPFAADFALLVPPGVHPTPLLPAASLILAAVRSSPVLPNLEALGMALAVFCRAADELSTSLAGRSAGSELMRGVDRVTGSEGSMDFTCRSTSMRLVAAQGDMLHNLGGLGTYSIAS